MNALQVFGHRAEARIAMAGNVHRFAGLRSLCRVKWKGAHIESRQCASVSSAAVTESFIAPFSEVGRCLLSPHWRSVR
jgi:hypothetical protein